MKRTLLMTVLAAALLFSACNTQTSDDKGSISGTPATGEDFVASRDLYVNLTDLSYSNDGTTWSDITTTEAQTLSSEGTIKLNSSNGYFIIADLTETTAKCAVHLTGTLPASTYTTGVRIKTNKSIECGVYLEDVTITSTNMPCIEMTKNGLVSLGFTGTNTLTDGRTFGTGYGPEYSTTSGATYTDSDGNTQTCTTTTKVCSTDNANASDSKAALYAKGSMTLFQKGTGTLTVSQGYKHNISSGCALVLQSGTYTLSSTAKSALYGEEWVDVIDGTYTITNTGSVSTSSKTVKKAHGIKADDSYSNSYVKIEGGTININATYGKGISAPLVYITGGTTTIATSGSTISSEGGQGGGGRGGMGSQSSSSTTTYTDADGVSVTDTITFAGEGIEGTYLVQITGGETSIEAADDGINVSSSDSTALFSMSGGKLYTYTSTSDGIDCNNNIEISGGTIVSIAPTGSEDAFDCGDNSNTITITGGLIAGVCGSSNGTKDINAKGSQQVFTTSGASGSNIVVQVNSSDALYFAYPKSSFSSKTIVLTAPGFTATPGKIYSAATFSGGTNFHGLYTSSPSVTSYGSSTISTSSRQ